MSDEAFILSKDTSFSNFIKSKLQSFNFKPIISKDLKKLNQWLFNLKSVERNILILDEDTCFEEFNQVLQNLNPEADLETLYFSPSSKLSTQFLGLGDETFLIQVFSREYFEYYIPIYLQEYKSKFEPGKPQYVQGHYLNKELEVGSFEELEEISEEVYSFSTEMGVHRRIIENIDCIIRELALNVLKHAGDIKEGSKDNLVKDKKVKIECYVNDDVFLIKIRDNYGKLTPERLYGNLKLALNQDIKNTNTLDSLKGLGFYFIYQLSHHLIIKITPDKETEVICLIRNYRKGFKKYKSETKGFNLFLRDEDVYQF